MKIRDFLETIYEHRGELGRPGKNCECGCPLRVAILARCPAVELISSIYCEVAGELLPSNPHPLVAACLLQLEANFTQGLADGWDQGKFYGDHETQRCRRYQLAGFLIGITLRPAPRELTA